MAPATTRCAVCVVIAVINACAAADTAGRHTSFAIAASGSVEPFPQRQPGQGSMVRQLEATTIVAAEGTNAAATPHTTAAKNISTAAAQDPSKTEDIPIPNEEIKGSLAVKQPVTHISTYKVFHGTACNFGPMLTEVHAAGHGVIKMPLLTLDGCKAQCDNNQPLCLSFEWRGHRKKWDKWNSKCEMFATAATNESPTASSLCASKKQLRKSTYTDGQLCRYTNEAKKERILPTRQLTKWQCKQACVNAKSPKCKGIEWIEDATRAKGNCKFFATTRARGESHVCYVLLDLD